MPTATDCYAMNIIMVYTFVISLYEQFESSYRILLFVSLS